MANQLVDGRNFSHHYHRPHHHHLRVLRSPFEEKHRASLPQLIAFFSRNFYCPCCSNIQVEVFQSFPSVLCEFQGHGVMEIEMHSNEMDELSRLSRDPIIK